MKRYFSKFLKFSVMLVIILTCIMSILYVGYFFYISDNMVSCALIIGLYFFIILLYKKFKYKISGIFAIKNEKAIFYIVGAALIIRILWVIFVPTNPTSDFALMYNSARDAAEGNFYMFKNYNYFARFAHDTITVLYFSSFYHIENYPLLLIKLANVIFGSASVYLCYLITKEAIGRKAAIITSLFIALFPAYIMYSSETMSENMALSFYLLSVYFFLRALNVKENSISMLLCGITLAIGNLFRMVGPVVLVAFIMYLLIYKGLKETISASLKIIISYTLLLFLVSQVLISAGITEVHLWNSKEPVITSVLKGTNIKHFGRWNEEDAKIPIKLNFDPEAIKMVSKEIIIQRLTETPKSELVFFYIAKLSSQWGLGDFKAYDLTVESSDNNSTSVYLKGVKSEVNIIFNLIYITLLIRILIALHKREYEDFEFMNFFFILFLGFVLLYLITEAQERYGYIAAWLILIFAARNANEKMN